MTTAKPIRYGKPCITNLPAKLGRQIFEQILHAPPFDDTQLKKDCARINRRLAAYGRKFRKNAVAAK